MPTIRLTQRRVDALRPRRKVRDVRDAEPEARAGARSMLAALRDGREPVATDPGGNLFETVAEEVFDRYGRRCVVRRPILPPQFHSTSMSYRADRAQPTRRTTQMDDEEPQEGAARTADKVA